jgi:hypothetical protein
MAGASLRRTFPTSIWLDDGRLDWQTGQQEAVPDDGAGQQGLTMARTEALICCQRGQRRELQLERTASRAMAGEDSAGTDGQQRGM